MCVHVHATVCVLKNIKTGYVFTNTGVNETLIFFKLVFLTFSTLISMNFPLVEAPLKFLF